jgi:hypothetical protein
VLKISSAFTPPPPEGFISPMTWCREQHHRALWPGRCREKSPVRTLTTPHPTRVNGVHRTV